MGLRRDRRDEPVRLPATDPRELREYTRSGGDIVGPENDRYLREKASAARLVMAAWGNHGTTRGHKVRALLDGIALHALATNKGGEPAHPLYQRSDREPIPWPR